MNQYFISSIIYRKTNKILKSTLQPKNELCKVGALTSKRREEKGISEEKKSKRKAQNDLE
jgi:hypothetical protein